MGSKIKPRQDRKPKNYFKKTNNSKYEGSVDRKVRNNMRQKMQADDSRDPDWDCYND